MAKLYFYYSAMNAGKTTLLLQSSYNYRERGIDTLLYLPDFDDRGGQGNISSRIGLASQAVTFSKTYDFYANIKRIKETEKPHLGCILLDEAQFLTPEQVRQLTYVVDRLHLPVLTYGLRSDFMGETFPGSQYLLTWAEEIEEVKTICFCGRKATMNVRIDEKGVPVTQGEQVEIGGNDRYIAVCRRHFDQCLSEKKPILYKNLHKDTAKEAA